MRISPPIFRSPRGATMLLVMMFAIIAGIAVTSWMMLMSARLQQAERQEDQVNRNVVWGNSAAINQQYALQYSFQDNVSRSASTSLLNSGTWGGTDQDVYSALKAFRSVNNYTTPGSYAFPFNNVRDTPTADGSVYFTRTTGDSDSSQSEHLAFFNYQKSYPAPLLGDLLIVHTKPTGASGSAYINDNLLVNGRVVIYDSTADVSGVKAMESINQTKTGTNYTLSTAGAAMLPTNFPATPHFTAGYGGSTVPTAVLDGSLNMINNPNFTPGSIVDIMTANGGYTNVSAGSASGTSTSAVQVVLQTTPTYAPPVVSPYNYSYTSPLNVVTVRLHNSALGHLRINGSVDQLVLQGQTNSTDWTAADALAPVIIWLEQEVRDVRLVGENNRRLIFVVGNGTGLTMFMGFSGTNITGTGALRWRMHLINQYRNIYLDAPAAGLNTVTITGSIRTNWSISCTDVTTGTTRFTLQTETSPGALATLLPRDGWFEPYFMVR